MSVYVLAGVETVVVSIYVAYMALPPSKKPKAGAKLDDFSISSLKLTFGLKYHSLPDDDVGSFQPLLIILTLMTAFSPTSSGEFSVGTLLSYKALLTRSIE